jgi:hypothetical protein
VVVKRIDLKTEAQLRRQLLDVPEVSLNDGGDSAATMLRDVGERSAPNSSRGGKPTPRGELLAQNWEQLLRGRILKRPDLAGLPMRLGTSCRLPEHQAKQLESSALKLRDILDRGSSASRSGSAEMYHDTPSYATLYGKAAKDIAVPALTQLLTPESQEFRTLLLGSLSNIPGEKASVALAQRALYDLDPNIREVALWALNSRPRSEFGKVFMQGLRHPWAPVAQHAAEALVALRMTATVPSLVGLLEQDDPALPIPKDGQKKPVTEVRELVRINHLSNCLLCHAPSADRKDPVRGLIPSPDRPIPTRKRVYYDSNRFGSFVRADVTYLRQDFSVPQPVKKPGRWPKEQRFDYLVRVRPLTAAEVKQTRQPRRVSEQRQAILFALRGLTGGDLGPSAQAWKGLLQPTEPEKRSVPPPHWLDQHPNMSKRSAR